MDNQKFGRFIASLRKEKGWTQLELANKLNVTDKAVSKWERGVGFPDLKMIEPLAEVLGVSVIEIMHSEKQNLKQIQVESDIMQDYQNYLKKMEKMNTIKNIIYHYLLCLISLSIIVAAIWNIVSYDGKLIHFLRLLFFTLSASILPYLFFPDKFKNCFTVPFALFLLFSAVAAKQGWQIGILKEFLIGMVFAEKVLLGNALVSIIIARQIIKWDCVNKAKNVMCKLKRNVIQKIKKVIHKIKNIIQKTNSVLQKIKNIIQKRGEKL